ncbi:hypothetical protein HK405_012062 [Cladochytrium tenue]|nr:hypothetical protein HK405_012062 [Cladochytrium tenue]
MGVKLTWQEMVDYTAAWRLIGHMLGIDDDANPCQWGVETSFYLNALFAKKYNKAYTEAGAVLAAATAPTSLPEGHPPIPASAAGAAAAAGGCPFAAADDDDLDASARAMASDITGNVLKSSARYFLHLPLGIHTYYFRRIMGPTFADRLQVPEAHGLPAACAKLATLPVLLEADILVGKSDATRADGRPAREEERGRSGGERVDKCKEVGE